MQVYILGAHFATHFKFVFAQNTWTTTRRRPKPTKREHPPSLRPYKQPLHNLEFCIAEDGAKFKGTYCVFVCEMTNKQDLRCWCGDREREKTQPTTVKTISQKELHEKQKTVSWFVNIRFQEVCMEFRIVIVFAHWISQHRETRVWCVSLSACRHPCTLVPQTHTFNYIACRCRANIIPNKIESMQMSVKVFSFVERFMSAKIA